MEVIVSTLVNAPKEKVWATLIDIENSDKFISGIIEVEVLENPGPGIMGLKWREKRLMFGKEAEETMWITGVEENSHYDVAAASHGAEYLSTMSIAENEGVTKLEMKFSAKSVTFGAKLMYGLMGWMFKSATVKALQQDLDDIKKHIEST